jgi:hypothetical protein
VEDVDRREEEVTTKSAKDEKGFCAPDELQRKMREIDREYGDRGQARAGAVHCP